MTSMATGAGLGGVADPRLDVADANAIGTSHDNVIHQVGPPDTHGHNTIYLDSSITFEDYHWWARRARQAEKNIPANAGFAGLFNVMTGLPKKSKLLSGPPGTDAAGDTKSGSGDASPDGHYREKSGDSHVDAGRTDSSPASSDRLDLFGVTPAEWETAQRAARTASWGAIFYLITTDILGPFSIPWAVAQLGFGPGVAIFVVFAVLAYYSAMQLWRMFIGLDSPRYPMRNYGDLAFRLFGNWARIIANFLQSFQFYLNLSVIIVANSQGLAQMAVGKNGNGFLCFVVAQVIFTLIGFLLGQIRTLQRLGWLANLSVWLNVTIIISTMVAVYKYPPNYAASALQGIPKAPIQASAGIPAGKTLVDNVNGMMNGVFAYGGATMFNELMAEMRRPWDFWKAILISNIFISSVYMIFGLVCYSRQGQFTYNPTFQGISHAGYTLQTLGNAIYFITSVIAALLYGNIGMKVLYAAIFRDVFKFPPLETTKGKWTWAIFVPLYWGLAFVLAAAVPQISNLVAFEGALTIMQFSYTFPPLLTVAYHCQKDSALPGEQYDPQTGQTIRHDSGFKRMWRGFKKRLVLNTWDSIYFLAALTTAILGIWAAISSMITEYKGSKVVSFGCHNPAG